MLIAASVISSGRGWWSARSAGITWLMRDRVHCRSPCTHHCTHQFVRYAQRTFHPVPRLRHSPRARAGGSFGRIGCGVPISMRRYPSRSRLEVPAISPDQVGGADQHWLDQPCLGSFDGAAANSRCTDTPRPSAPAQDHSHFAQQRIVLAVVVDQLHLGSSAHRGMPSGSAPPPRRCRSRSHRHSGSPHAVENDGIVSRAFALRPSPWRLPRHPDRRYAEI